MSLHSTGIKSGQLLRNAALISVIGIVGYKAYDMLQYDVWDSQIDLSRDRTLYQSRFLGNEITYGEWTRNPSTARFEPDFQIRGRRGSSEVTITITKLLRNTDWKVFLDENCKGYRIKRTKAVPRETTHEVVMGEDAECMIEGFQSRERASR